MTDTFRDLFNFFLWNNSQQANPQNAVESQSNPTKLGKGKSLPEQMSSDRGRGTREERRKAETDQGPQHVDALLIGEDQKRQERERDNKARLTVKLKLMM